MISFHFVLGFLTGCAIISVAAVVLIVASIWLFRLHDYLYDRYRYEATTKRVLATASIIGALIFTVLSGAGGGLYLAFAVGSAVAGYSVG